MDDINLIQAEIAIILDRLLKLEREVRGCGSLTSLENHMDKLKQDAIKMINQNR